MKQTIESASFLSVVEKAFVVLALILFTGAFFTLLNEDTTATAQDDSLFIQAVYVSVYGITILLIAARLRHTIMSSLADPLLLLILVIAGMSTLWSAEPSVSLRGSVALVGTTAFGIYLAVRFSFQDQLRLVAWALGIAALCSLAFGLALPEYGVTMDFRGGEAWRGIYHQKNVLGRLMSLSGVIFLLLALSSHTSRWLKWSGAGISVGLMILANSATSLVAFMVLLILLPLYKTLRRQFTLAAPTFIAVTLMAGTAAIWLADNSENVLTALGRDATLTGRTKIWSAVLSNIWERPWLGYGYGGFWRGWEGESAQVWLMLPQNNLPTHAHNGFLDIWLDLGLLGLAVFVLRLVLVFLLAVLWTHSTRTWEDLWPVSFLTFLLLYSIAYPVGLEQNSIWWVLYVATTLPLVARVGRSGNSQSAKYAIGSRQHGG